MGQTVQQKMNCCCSTQGEDLKLQFDIDQRPSTRRIQKPEDNNSVEKYIKNKSSSGVRSTQEDKGLVTDESEVEDDGDKENKILDAPQALEWKQERRMDTMSGASSMRSIPCYPYNESQRDTDIEPEVELIILSQTDNNNKYKGDLIGNQKHGNGQYKFSDGSIFVGTWVENKISGNGTLRTKDGTAYSGEWQNDRLEGEGEIRWINGIIFTGIFSNGKRNGLGIFKWPNASRYIGEWSNGHKDGLGTHQNEKGDSVIEEWDQGVRQSVIIEDLTKRSGNLSVL